MITDAQNINEVDGLIIAEFLAYDDTYGITIYDQMGTWDHKCGYASAILHKKSGELRDVTMHDSDVRANIAAMNKVHLFLAGESSPVWDEFGIFISDDHNVHAMPNDSFIWKYVDDHGCVIGYNKTDDTFWHGPMHLDHTFDPSELVIVDIDDLIEDPNDELRDEYVQLKQSCN